MSEPLNDSVAERHTIHYRNCNCLADTAECCVPSCPCHGTEPLNDSCPTCQETGWDLERVAPCADPWHLGTEPLNDSAPTCCLCGKPCEPWHEGSTGYGHNPDPFGEEGDRCCNECNATKVIPARIDRLYRRSE